MWGWKKTLAWSGVGAASTVVTGRALEEMAPPEMQRLFLLGTLVLGVGGLVYIWTR